MGGWLLPHREGRNNSNPRENMLDYLISLFDDTNDFSLDAAKTSHTVFLCRLEQIYVLDCYQTEKSTK